MRQTPVECEFCDAELHRGEEAYLYDACYFCSTDCIQAHLYEGERQDIAGVVIP